MTNNIAKCGGGLSLQASAKLSILKYDIIHNGEIIDTNTTIFTANHADCDGGAIYVDDASSGTCVSNLNSKAECFFQVLALYDDENLDIRDVKTQSMYFSKNSANMSGSTLYGGLLDRCAVSKFAEYYKRYAHDSKDIGGIAYFKNVSIATNTSISSGPVRVCLCFHGYGAHDCLQTVAVSVRKGAKLIVPLFAVDQMYNHVKAVIQDTLSYSISGLAEGQLSREVNVNSKECAALNFNIVSSSNSGELIIHAADGPCRDLGLSIATVKISFLPCSCPIGLQVNSATNNTNCTCECYRDIRQYMKQCNNNGSIVKQPQSRAWISSVYQ